MGYGHTLRCLQVVRTADFKTFQNKADSLGLSLIVQANRLMQIEQIGISLSVSIHVEPVQTI